MRSRFVSPRQLRRLKLLAAALDAVEIPVMLAEPEGEQRIVYVNPAARELFQASAEELNRGLRGADVCRAEGGSIHVFHHDPERVRRVIEELKRRGETHSATEGTPIPDPVVTRVTVGDQRPTFSRTRRG